MKIEQVKKELAEIKRTSFGISIPELRKFAKKLAKEDYKEFLKTNKNETFELRLLNAFLIGYIKADIQELLKYFEDFMPYVNDWAVCDSLCQNFKITRQHPKEVWEFLMRFKNSKKEFESRIVSVIMLSHYLNDEYIDSVIEVLNGLNTDDYYSQMGAAWLTASITGKYPDKCIEYLQSDKCRLDKETRKKSLQKIRESFKIPEKTKKYIKNLSIV